MRSLPILGAGLLVASCASVGVSHQQATQAMIVAEASFNAAANAERQAKHAGLLTGEKAAQADVLVKQAYDALRVLRVAYRAGASPSTANLLALTAQILTFIQ